MNTKSKTVTILTLASLVQISYSQNLTDELLAIRSALNLTSEKVRGNWPPVAGEPFALVLRGMSGQVIEIEVSMATTIVLAKKKLKWLRQTSVGLKPLRTLTGIPVGDESSASESEKALDLVSRLGTMVVSIRFNFLASGASSFATSSTQRAIIEGTARKIFARMLGEDLRAASSIQYRNLQNIASMIDASGNRYISLSSWNSAWSRSVQFDAQSAIALVTRNGTSYSFLAGTAAVRRGSSDLPSTASIALKNGQYWIPYQVIDTIVN